MARATLEGPPPATRWQVASGRSVMVGPAGATLIEAGYCRMNTPASGLVKDTFLDGDVIEVSGDDTSRLVDLGFLVPPGTARSRPSEGYVDPATGMVSGGVAVTEESADPAAIGMIRSVVR